MANSNGRPNLKLTIPPSNEPPCECMMCNISKDLTKEDQANLPCLRHIPTRLLVEKGVLSRKGRLPMSRSQKRGQLPVELPADVPVELPAESSIRSLVELPGDYPVPVELPADPPISTQEEELIDGIPVSIVLLLRQIHRETEGIASGDANRVQTAAELSSDAEASYVSPEELPKPSIRLSIENLIDEGKPQAWPHPESVPMVSDVGSVQHKPTVVSPSTVQRAVPQAASVGFSGYVAWSPRFETLATASPYSPGKPRYQAYRPGL